MAKPQVNKPGCYSLFTTREKWERKVSVLTLCYCSRQRHTRGEVRRTRWS